MSKSMEQIVALCKRRGFIFQNSDIYGGQQGFWDYGPLGTELKRNVRNAWYNSMVTNHDELTVPEGAPSPFQMVGIETSIIMHPSVWKASGHYDLFHDFMVDCKSCKSRFRVDHISTRVILDAGTQAPIACETYMQDVENDTGLSKAQQKRLDKAIQEYGKPTLEETMSLDSYLKLAAGISSPPVAHCPDCHGELTDPREFNLMFKTIVGALSGEEGTAFLRPETAQGMFVNFKNVVDSSRVKLPFGIAQIGKSFRNEITPRNFTFRSRE
ncbi:MAG: glycine--tRNA ligase, partial [Planctomycetaceae bacterium]|nr:glycine--tRNA ligase [Planctomycetaceae bacterium]